MKSASTIDLMKTSNGYSVIENEVLYNKVSNPNSSQSNPNVAQSNSAQSGTAKYNK